jgi:Glycosyl transferase family 2
VSTPGNSGHRPLVTAIIVNWNRRGHLEDCLPSLAQQTYPSLEVRVVDNGSTDGSAQIVREAKMGWLPLGRNIGLAPATNEGARRASGEYLLFLNNDMRFAGLRRAARRELGSQPERLRRTRGSWTGMTTAPPVHERTRLTELWHRRPVDGSMVDQEPTEGVVECLFASAANIVVRRDRFDALGGWDAGYPICYEDMDLCMPGWSGGWPPGQVRLALGFFPWPEVARTLLASLRGTASDLVHGRRHVLGLRLVAWRVILMSLPGALKKRRTIRRISGRSPREFLEWLARL